jgi:single-strand DNA-binding protein
MLIGNVGNDPEVRATPNGARVAQFNLATTRTWNGPAGDKQEKTEWHRCVLWNGRAGGGLADVVERYVRKGDRLYIEGSIEYRQWQDREGQTRYTTEIKVREMVMLGSRSSGGGGGGDVENGGGRSRSAAPARSSAAAAAGDVGGGGDFEDFPGALEDEDDDLPF